MNEHRWDYRIVCEWSVSFFLKISHLRPREAATTGWSRICVGCLFIFYGPSIACFHLAAVATQQGITALTHAVKAAGGQPGTVSSLKPNGVLCKFSFLFFHPYFFCLLITSAPLELYKVDWYWNISSITSNVSIGLIYTKSGTVVKAQVLSFIWTGVVCLGCNSMSWKIAVTCGEQKFGQILTFWGETQRSITPGWPIWQSDMSNLPQPDGNITETGRYPVELMD